VRDLGADSHVALAYVGGSKRAPLWIHVEGRAKVTDDAKLKKEKWVDELDRWLENGPGDPAVVLIHVVAKRASYWSFEEQGEVELG
jgi:general stress protein 26